MFRRHILYVGLPAHLSIVCFGHCKAGLGDVNLNQCTYGTIPSHVNCEDEDGGEIECTPSILGV